MLSSESRLCSRQRPRWGRRSGTSAQARRASRAAARGASRARCMPGRSVPLPSVEVSDPPLSSNFTFLLDDVGAGTGGPLYELGLLAPASGSAGSRRAHDRRSISPSPSARAAASAGDVVRAAGRLVRASRAQLREERVPLELGAERRLRTVPGIHGPSPANSARRVVRTDARSVSQSPPARSTRPTEPAKSRSPLNSCPSVRTRRAPASGRDRKAFEGDPRNVDRLAALEQVIRACKGGPARRPARLGVALEALALPFGHVDRCSGALGGSATPPSGRNGRA